MARRVSLSSRCNLSRPWCETVKTLVRLQSVSRCTSSIQKMSVIASLPPSFHTTGNYDSDLEWSNTG